MNDWLLNIITSISVVMTITTLIPFIFSRIKYRKNKMELLQIEKKYSWSFMPLYLSDMHFGISDEDRKKMIGRNPCKKISSTERISLSIDILSNYLSEVYKDNTIAISIKILYKSSDDTVAKNYYWLSNKNDNPVSTEVYSVKNNTGLNNLYYEGYDKFVVTNFDYYQNRGFAYKNTNTTWRDKYNATIVLPIKTKKNENDDERNIIGFLCIDFKEKLNEKIDVNDVLSLPKKIAELISSDLKDIPATE